MNLGSGSLEKRLGDHIKNYTLYSLFENDKVKEQAQQLYNLFELQICITDRHGEKVLQMGDFADFNPDVVQEPGRKIRIANRTVAHLYVKYDKVETSKEKSVRDLFETVVVTWELLAENRYYSRETALYIEELEEKLEKDAYQVKHGVKLDALTEVLNRVYFENRLKIVDRSQIAPVAAMCININDWKFFNTHYGDEESDRLIQIVASIIRKQAKPEYIIGRVDGDVFHVLIPMPEDMECEDYCRRIKEDCDAYEDTILAPSVAIGCVYKENVEGSLEECLSEAEYEMFDDKLNMKKDEKYQKRLEKGLHL